MAPCPTWSRTHCHASSVGVESPLGTHVEFDLETCKRGLRDEKKFDNQTKLEETCALEKSSVDGDPELLPL